MPSPRCGPARGISPGSNQAAWALSRAEQPGPRRTARPRLGTHARARMGSSGLRGYRRSALGRPAHPATYQVRSFPSASPRITSCRVACDDRGVIAVAFTSHPGRPWDKGAGRQRWPAIDGVALRRGRDRQPFQLPLGLGFGLCRRRPRPPGAAPATGIPRCRRPREQHHPVGQADERQIRHTDRHEPAILPGPRPSSQTNLQVSYLCPVLEPHRGAATRAARAVAFGVRRRYWQRLAAA
jgi:hypothetical protein